MFESVKKAIKEARRKLIVAAKVRKYETPSGSLRSQKKRVVQMLHVQKVRLDQVRGLESRETRKGLERSGNLYPRNKVGAVTQTEKELAR